MTCCSATCVWCPQHRCGLFATRIRWFLDELHFGEFHYSLPSISRGIFSLKNWVSRTPHSSHVWWRCGVFIVNKCLAFFPSYCVHWRIIYDCDVLKEYHIELRSTVGILLDSLNISRTTRPLWSPVNLLNLLLATGNCMRRFCTVLSNPLI